MRKLVAAFLISSSLFGSVKSNLYWLNHKMSKAQYDVMIETYHFAKPYDLQFTAMAIAWQESKFGKWKHNLADPSCGVFHQLLPDLAKRYNVKATMWNMSRLCDNLMFYDYAFKVFIDTFKEKEIQCFNRGYRSKGSNWRCAVESYNAYGNKAYYKAIRDKVKALRIWFRRHEIKN